jgi:hypothetical protein
MSFRGLVNRTYFFILHIYLLYKQETSSSFFLQKIMYRVAPIFGLDVNFG